MSRRISRRDLVFWASLHRSIRHLRNLLLQVRVGGRDADLERRDERRRNGALFLNREIGGVVRQSWESESVRRYPVKTVRSCDTLNRVELNVQMIACMNQKTLGRY